MGAKKIKVAKKGVEKTEEILDIFDQIKVWAEQNTTLVSLGVVVIILIPLVFWGVTAYSQGKERKAQAAYALVFEDWTDKSASDSNAWEKLITPLEKCVEAHPGTKAALSAQLDLAQAYFHVGKYEDAKMWSNRIVEETKADNDLRALARYQLAQSFEMLGRTDEAVNQWQILQKEQLPELGREVEWHLADLYAKKGDFAKAVTHYELAISTPGSYPSAPMLQEQLAVAKTKTGPADAGANEKETKQGDAGANEKEPKQDSPASQTKEK